MKKLSLVIPMWSEPREQEILANHPHLEQRRGVESARNVTNTVITKQLATRSHNAKSVKLLARSHWKMLGIISCFLESNFMLMYPLLRHYVLNSCFVCFYLLV